jgi:tetratricopeptide (TPR) repeat protein
MLFGFGRALFETGHTNEALSTLARAVDLTRPLLDQAQGNEPWMMLRDTAQSQAQMGDMRAALATAELIRDPEQWSSAHVLVLRAQIAQGDLEGARRSFDQLVKAQGSFDQSVKTTEDPTHAGQIFRDFQGQSARELGTGLAKTGRTDEARKLMADALNRMRKTDTKGEQTEFLKQFEAQVPIILVYGLIEGGHFTEAAEEVSSIHDDATRNGLASQLEAARVEAGDASEPANADVSSAVTAAGKAAKARKLAQCGQFAEALKLAEPLPSRDAQSVFGEVVQTAIKSNQLAQAQQALKTFPVAPPQGQWDDGGTGFKASLLQELAKAQVQRQLTNEARATLREAATLCARSENQNVRIQLVKIVPQLAELAEAEAALATLAAQKSRLPLFDDAAASTGEALVRSLGSPAAISRARAQTDKNLELCLLLGVAGSGHELPKRLK